MRVYILGKGARANGLICIQSSAVIYLNITNLPGAKTQCESVSASARGCHN